MTGFLKKLGVVVAAVLVALSFTTVAFAATITITETNEDKKIISQEDGAYEGYQILSGTISKNAVGKDVISNAAWGEGIDSVNFLADLKKDATIGADFATVVTVEDFVKVIYDYGDDTDKAKLLATIVSKNLTTTKVTSTNVNAGIHTIDVGDKTGWYFIKDVKGKNPNAITRFMLLVSGNVDVAPKADYPSFDKEVMDFNDSLLVTDHDHIWRKTADHDIDGEIIPYRLVFEVPGDYDSYTNGYKLVFHDNMSPGLVLDPKSILVFRVRGNLSTTEQDLKNDPNALLISLVRGSNMPKAGNPIPVNYVITTGDYEPYPGQQDDPRYTGGTRLDITFEDLRRMRSYEDDEKIDLLPGDKIVVLYNCRLDLDKSNIGSAGNPNEAWTDYSNNPNVFTPEDMGTTPPVTNIVFTYKYVINKVDKNGNPLEGATFSLLKLEPQYKGADAVKDNDPQGRIWRPVKNLKVTGATFEFKGIDDGIYRVVETDAPQGGYAPIDPFEFKVIAVHDDKTLELQALTGELITGAIQITSNVPKATLTSDIVNDLPWLPVTGGMGTVLFYLVGGILIVGAGVLFFVKRRTSKE